MTPVAPSSVITGRPAALMRSMRDGTWRVTALPFVVLTYVEQDHRPVEYRRNIDDLQLRDLHLVHARHADTACRQAMLVMCAHTLYQQFRAIHTFHRFIHSPPSAETPFEPVNLWARWKLLWITLGRHRPPINRQIRAGRNGLPR
jgi:hypothetical protein